MGALQKLEPLGGTNGVNVRGLSLPLAFVQATFRGLRTPSQGSYGLRTTSDSFGHPLETELANICTTPTAIESATVELPDSFRPDGCYGGDEIADEPGAIADIVDFSSILSIGAASDGSPFCLDYRNDAAEEPSVIWWDDTYWRCIAPNFAAFLSLFDLPDST